MILVTVGTQLPFDRLVKAMDAVAPTLDEPVVAQTGQGAYQPRHMQAQSSYSAMAFDQLAAEASLLVSHAGTGSILLAQRLQKPILLLARRAALGEHRNDHQLATAQQMAGRGGIYVAENETDIPATLIIAREGGFKAIIPDGRQQLTDAIRSFLRL